MSGIKLAGVVAAGLFVGWLAWEGVPYALATYQFDQLSEERPDTRTQVEETLFFYRTKTIPVTESQWGSDIPLGPGDYCQQYLILGKEPIDVIYDGQENVLHIMSSFE